MIESHSHSTNGGHTHKPEQITRAVMYVQDVLAAMLRPVDLNEPYDGLIRFRPDSMEAAVIRRILRETSKDYGVPVPEEATP